MMNEIWKDIPNYEDLYQASNFGRIRSLKYRRTNQCGILKQNLSSTGYYIVVLVKNKVAKTFKVHRLVAMAFLSNPDNLPCVNHKDETRTNNHVENLEWCTHKYNHNYGTVKERLSKAHTNGKNSKTVCQYTRDGKFVREWPSAMECGRNGYHSSHIAACCLGKLKTHKGYIWRYAST